METFEQELLVRFRVDGVLREVVRPKRQLAPLLVSRIKVMAKLDIAEARASRRTYFAAYWWPGGGCKSQHHAVQCWRTSGYAVIR